ncbi:MAG TPA: protein-glutamate O-methyltransferase CheR, partial [Candidatus Nitrosotenuis sp.]|nr:protein-glutamate O-methyltransferase CheR [Candidatus Nitrosotenuis sp.]
MTEAAARLLADPAFSALKAFILEATGLVYYADRDEDLALRLQRRMMQLSLPDCGSYFSHLRAPGSEEMDRLVTELTIGETYFFRHPEQFQALRQRALPDILERARSTRRLRIWCAACATGPEPYSLSILLRREMGLALAGWKISILGTDINKEFLAQARRARFPDWSLRGLDEDLRQACFRREGAEWVLDPAYCEGVFFQYHNLVRHPFPSVVEGLCAFDLIFCRNVMIYFDRQICSRLVP